MLESLYMVSILKIFFTAPDGTTRVVTGPTNILPKSTVQGAANSPQQSLIKVANQSATPTSIVPQKVQILRGPDGKIEVRGLMPGQQLLQMPDGKLHVLNTSSQTVIATNQTSVNTTASPATVNINFDFF